MELRGHMPPRHPEAPNPPVKHCQALLGTPKAANNQGGTPRYS